MPDATILLVISGPGSRRFHVARLPDRGFSSDRSWCGKMGAVARADWDYSRARRLGICSACASLSGLSAEDLLDS